MKTLFCDNIAGIAGNMFAASFVDAGLVTQQELKELTVKLGLPEIKLLFHKVDKSGIEATLLEVDLSKLNDQHPDSSGHHHDQQHHHGHKHFTYREILDRIEQSDLTPNTKKIASSIYRLLAESEAEVHGVPIEKVHFHEVGNPDSLIDVVMAGYILDKMEYDRVCSTPVKLGRGLIKIDHGTYPVPPPATALLADGFSVDEVPEAITERNVELTTPTGAAIIKYLDPDFLSHWPGGISIGHGYGAGSMDLEGYPNVFRIALFEETNKSTDSTSLPYIEDKVVEISCNIDDQTPEKTGWCMQKLIELGALDVWFTPIQMKKNRPAICLSVLAENDDWKRLADWILRNSSTFGIRYKVWERLNLDRIFEKRIEDNVEITYKLGKTTDNEILKAKPEYDDVKDTWNS